MKFQGQLKQLYEYIYKIVDIMLLLVKIFQNSLTDGLQNYPEKLNLNWNNSEANM